MATQDRSKALRRTWTIVFVGSFLLSCGFLTSCSEKRGPSIHIIVPVGFNGLIKIVKDTGAAKIELEGGEYVYRIPTNGTLTVREARGFANWHYTLASYADGRSLPIFPESSEGEIALFELGSSSSGKKFLFVGTENEKKEAMKDSFNLLR